MPDRPAHGGYRRTESLVERARRLAPEGGRVEGLSSGAAYIEVRRGVHREGGIVTAVLCPDDRTMSASWTHLEAVIEQRLKREERAA